VTSSHTERFRITWDDGQYKVSVPRYDGGEVVDAASYDRQRAALVHAVSVIQQWHNGGLRGKDASELWDIYWRNAPEMKQIRDALTDEEVSRG
jgi:hypothetical protein